MKNQVQMEKKIVSAMLLAAVAVGSISGKAYEYADELISAVGNEITAEKEDEIPSYQEITQNFLSKLPFKQHLVNLNGTLSRSLGLREIYQNTGGIVLKNGYVANVYSPTTTDYEIAQIAELKAFLDARGIQLLYVNEPTKYFDDAIVETELGKPTCINSNTDTFLKRLDDIGVHYLDLRESYTQMGYDSFELFYKTDHHWTVSAGKMAAELIAAELNEWYGYNIDLSLYDDAGFTVTHYENAWLGESGKKLGVSFVGLDDYDLVLPDYPTDYTVTYPNGVITTGCFGDTIVNPAIYLPENNTDVSSAPSWHYSYMANGLNESVVVNNYSTEGKKILVLGDSYEQVTVPFLSLGVSEVQTLVLRSYDGSLREYIDSHEIDTVVIAYALFMIGAHDNEESANYAMFEFP